MPGTQTRFSQEPADQTVVAGQRAVLPCVLLNYSGIVQWTKDGLALGMGQGLKGEWGHPASLASKLSHLCNTTPQPTRIDSWTQLLFVPHLTTSLLFSPAPPLPSVWVRLSPCPTELCLHCFPNSQLCLSCSLWAHSKKATGSLTDQRKPRDLYVKELQTDSHQESCCCRRR